MVVEYINHIVTTLKCTYRFTASLMTSATLKPMDIAYSLPAD